MRSSLLPVALVLVAFAGCRSAEVLSQGPRSEPAPPPERADYLPAGTQLVAELDQRLSTDGNRTGDRFTATVKEPLIARNGDVAVPRGAKIHGVITGLDPSEHAGEQAAIRLAFENLEINGRSYPLSADIVDTEVDVGTPNVAREAGVGAAAGAALGAVLGGDLSDILSGAILGAGVGTIISLGTGTVDAALPAGSDLTIRTNRAITLSS